MKYQFHPAAEAEYLESVAYFESKQPGLGASYLMEFERVLSKVCEAPDRYPAEGESRVRKVQMRRFPFAVLYRVSSDKVQVLAVAHHRRRPQYWLGRI
ncbi:MAG: type II toxin-antitoxin system RelE/ParE family toxin [Gammaproteobacteria bacterium]|jgi:plasmid stabilization system protein ParE|nr:type II toxin-antitoxin system RelE/ParE family toxin [Gammaproteobacteria bacterium]MBT4607168.1 type II toxin-antitoxin system RelE/ParE family toxin [Thiotrichales bacterium]MBT3472462.1 type II toxin-antitoxin system RelE/ParE family toxin [Gammaproteobacteria bacterium]MBT3968274.1 type II toxin-antitoxin system RelE/ParE family toxin [Gammaproteobacteria bacterium]MBT4081305.1 type II toxin-antitoxin system RelE/ParE family toxin [Gammaproteobacteria bacterium]